MIGAKEIKSLLPHRYPMLLVDRVVEAVPGERLVALKAVTLNEPWYAVADVEPAYPGTLLIESWGQSAGLLGILSAGDDADFAGQVMLFGSASGIEFHREVHPGDVVEHRVRLTRIVGDNLIFEGDSVVGGDTVITVERMVMAFRPAATLRPDPVGAGIAPAASQRPTAEGAATTPVAPQRPGTESAGIAGIAGATEGES
jgi:3-hydroxyacyl-[acyl-carrier-protein] dehydratase